MVSLVTREDGYVLLKHRDSNRRSVLIDADKTRYDFSTTNPDGQVRNANLSLAWVAPQHVDQLFRIQGRVCCGKSGQLFYPANELDLKLWMTGDR